MNIKFVHDLQYTDVDDGRTWNTVVVVSTMARHSHSSSSSLASFAPCIGLTFVILFVGMQVFFFHHVEPMARIQNHVPCQPKDPQRRQEETEPKSHTTNKFLQRKEWPTSKEEFFQHGIPVGDPQMLLDFAIVGTEKSGTSTLMKWFGAHEQVQCFQEEIYDLYDQKPETFVTREKSIFVTKNS